MATNKPASSRRGPSESAKRRSEAVCAPAVKFPLKLDKPRQIAPQECSVVILATAEDGVKLQVIPKVVSVRDILNETYGPLGWTDRYYFCGGVTHCQVGIKDPNTWDFVYKDAGPMKLPVGDPAQMQEGTSFLRAAAKWGLADDVMELGPIALKSSQVTMKPNEKGGGWHVDGKLTVDKFARAEDGHICMVQLLRADGQKVLWDEKA